MIGALILAVVTSATASPLPIIITTESSPVCQTLREKIAPAISRVVYEDRVMARQRPLEKWPQANQTVYTLAVNWVKLAELLNPDTFFHSDNPADNARMEALREKLQKIADDQNNALNILSGSFDTYEMEALAAEGPGFGGMYANYVNSGPLPEIPKYGGGLEGEYLRRQAQTQTDELTIYTELQPVIAQCAGPKALPSVAPSGGP
ncbi:MAG TPA: hypothetical protein VMB20_03495 [Candidatus Acidoferrum sp.]|nr:hypothetical protein [Candidatus Acidoferrum sp.]